MSKQKLDDGYQAVAFEVGKSLENAEARIRELEAQLAEAEEKRKNAVTSAKAFASDRDKQYMRAEAAEAQLAEARGDMQCLRQELGRLRAAIGPQHCDIHARFSAGCLNCRLQQIEAQLAAQNIRANERVADALKDRADMVDRAVKAEAQLAEANYRVQVHSDIAAENNLLRCKAEARAEALRKALEMVEWVSIAGCDHSMLECPWCDELEYPSQRHADDCVRQAALAPTPAEPPQVFPWKAGDMLRAELEARKSFKSK